MRTGLAVRVLQVRFCPSLQQKRGNFYMPTVGRAWRKKKNEAKPREAGEKRKSAGSTMHNGASSTDAEERFLLT